jgi:hypothetical protein
MGWEDCSSLRLCAFGWLMQAAAWRLERFRKLPFGRRRIMPKTRRRMA